MGLQTPSLPQTSYTYGKGEKNENLDFIIAVVNIFQLDLEGTPRTINDNSKGLNTYNMHVDSRGVKWNTF